MEGKNDNKKNAFCCIIIKYLIANVFVNTWELL